MAARGPSSSAFRRVRPSERLPGHVAWYITSIRNLYRWCPWGAAGIVVPVHIGGVRFRITCDTGAARNLVRQSFVEQLRRNPKTKDALIRRGRGDRVINCTGICKGMSTASIEYCSEIELLWKSVSSDGSKPPPDFSRRVMFSELPEGSDALLLGYPLLAEVGYHTYKDDDDVLWVEFKGLGVTLVAENPPALGD